MGLHYPAFHVHTYELVVHLYNLTGEQNVPIQVAHKRRLVLRRFGLSEQGGTFVGAQEESARRAPQQVIAVGKAVLNKKLL